MADISKENLRKEIAAILKDADLSSTSTKKVRQELEEKLDANLQSRKKEIDDLVMEFVRPKQDKKLKGNKGDSEEDGEEEDEEEEEEEEEEDGEKLPESSNASPEISKEDLRKEISLILKDADLSTTSTKKVRQELEEKLDANLQSRKKEIDDIVMEFILSKQDKKGNGTKNDTEEDGEEGVEEEEEDEEEEEEPETAKKPKKRASSTKKPPAKKARRDSEDDEEEPSEPSGDDDSEEYSPTKKAKPAKARKLPPKKKKGSESDSDEDWGSTKKKRKKGGGKKGGSGYTKTMKLSPELAAVVGQDSMARHEVVKKIWSIIKEKNLYDPKNRQYAVCDDALMKVIGVKRFRTFGMMRYLKSHFS